MILRPTIVAVLLAFPGAMGAKAQTTLDAPKASTLNSGNFDDFLMLAADHDRGTLSGYYDDGRCRFAFLGPLTPTALYQREDFGEAYEVEAWEPSHPELPFPTTIYSRARGGYQAQLTLEPGGDGPERPAGCRSRISLDRFGNTADSFYAVRIVRNPRAPVFDFKKIGGKLRLVRTRQRAPGAGKGVWAAHTYSADRSRRGFVYVNWYWPVGTPHGGYLRTADLYPEPRIGAEAN